MSEVHSLVQEFRDTVDGVIKERVAEIKASRSIPIDFTDYRKQQKVGDMYYASMDEAEGRFTFFPHSAEHMWGVACRTDRYRRPAYLAIVSTFDKPDRLTRRVAFDSAMQMIDVPTSLDITDEETMAKAVRWATGSNLARSLAIELSEITPMEQTRVDARLGEIAREQDQLRRDLEQISAAERRAAAEAHTVYLD